MIRQRMRDIAYTGLFLWVSCFVLFALQETPTKARYLGAILSGIFAIYATKRAVRLARAFYRKCKSIGG